MVLPFNHPTKQDLQTRYTKNWESSLAFYKESSFELHTYAMPSNANSNNWTSITALKKGKVVHWQV